MFNKILLPPSINTKTNIYTFIPEFQDGGSKTQSLGFNSRTGFVPFGYLSPSVINYDNIEYRITSLQQAFMFYSPEGCFISTEPELNKQIKITNLTTNKSALVNLNKHDTYANLSSDLDITIENAGKTFYLSLEII